MLVVVLRMRCYDTIFVSIQSKRETKKAIVIGALNILFPSKINIKNCGKLDHLKI